METIFEILEFLTDHLFRFFNDPMEYWHVITLLVILYFLPGLIAWTRNVKYQSGIWIVNIFIGWSFVAWVVILAMAVSLDSKK